MPITRRDLGTSLYVSSLRSLSLSLSAKSLPHVNPSGSLTQMSVSDEGG